MITCVKCELQYQTAKIGAAVQTMTADGRPYQLFAADRLECPGCGHSIARTANFHMAEHFEHSFSAFAARFERQAILMRAWATPTEKAKAEGRQC
jgi:hypothetical protein